MAETRTFEQCMEAVAAVARARRIELDDTVVTDTMRYVDSLAANATTSLQRDIAEGKPSEIDYWNGTVVRQERMATVSTPVNFIYHSLFPEELKARGNVCFPHEPRRNFHSWC
jgi:2-dehydropantoate 2-reductase